MKRRWTVHQAEIRKECVSKICNLKSQGDNLVSVGAAYGALDCALAIGALRPNQYVRMGRIVLSLMR